MDFWEVHGWGFIIGMFLFPRVTMLVATVSGGFLWWFGWLLFPRITVALLATVHYGHTNPVLVGFTWLWALSGELFEKGTMLNDT